MSFLFVDRILTLNPGKETVGIKQVTSNDVFLKPDAMGRLTLFPCVIGEALGQLCSWNVLKASEFSFRPVGGVIKEIQMHADAYIGDTILLESNIETLDPDNHIVSFSGQASVQGKTLITVKNSLAPLLPLQEFNNLEQVQTDFAKLNNESAKMGGAKMGSAKMGSDPDLLGSDPIFADPALIYKVAYDEILSSQVGHEIVAQKNVSLSAPYFATHFPNKPVFPLSLLMEYNLQLAHAFIAEQPTHTNKNDWRPLALRKVKISNFILPGDSVITRITLKEQHDNRYIMSIHNEVNSKKVCVAEVEFG